MGAPTASMSKGDSLLEHLIHFHKGQSVIQSYPPSLPLASSNGGGKWRARATTCNFWNSLTENAKQNSREMTLPSLEGGCSELHTSSFLPSFLLQGAQAFLFFLRMCPSHSFQSLPAALICLSLTLVDPLKTKWSNLSVPRDICVSPKISRPSQKSDTTSSGSQLLLYTHPSYQVPLPRRSINN